MLVGRDELLDHLQALLCASSPALLVGEAGMGKTTVLRAAAAAHGGPWRYGGGVAALSWMPYLPLARALQTSLPDEPAAAAAFVQQQLAGALLVLDDLQWCDDRSLQVLALLPPSTRLLTAVGEDDAYAPRVLELARTAGWSQVRVRPLGDEAATALVRVLDPAVTQHDLDLRVRRAAGNPLLLEHLTGAADPGRGDLQSVLAARLRHLPGECRRSMALLGLLGRPAPPEVLGGAADQLRACGLVIDDLDGTVRPRHELLAEAAVELLEEGERRSLHQDLARLAEHPAEAAAHHSAAGDGPAAVEAAHRALAIAATPGERAHALRVLATNLPEPTSSRVRLEAADALIEADDPRLALALTESVDVEGVDRVRALLLRAKASWLLGEPGTTRSCVEEGLSLAAGTDSAEELALRILDARLLVRAEWRPKEAVDAAQEALALATAIGRDEGPAHSVLGSALLIAGSPAWSDELTAALETARFRGEHETECVAADSLVAAQFLAGDPSRIFELCDEMIARTIRLGMRGWELQFRKNRVVFGFHAGADYREVVAESRALLELPHGRRAREQLEATLALALAITGDDRAATDVIDAALARPSTDDTARALLLWSTSEADWLAGRFPRAVARAEQCLALPVGGFPAMTLSGLTRQWSLYERGAPSDEVVEASTFPSLAAAVTESRALVLLSGPDRPEEAERRFLEAAEQWRPFQMYASLRCRWAAGEAAGRAGAVERASHHLRAVEADAASLGCSQLLRRIHRSMRRLGLRPRPVGAGTARQEVLELVTQGRTSAEIARQLALSPATVEGHIRAAMREFGAHTRLEAALRAIAKDVPPAQAGRGPAAVVASDRVAFTAAIAQLRAEQRVIRQGWDVPRDPWDLSEQRLLCVGEVRVAQDAARAVEAAVRGVDLVVLLRRDAPAAVRAPFLDSLRRVALVECTTSPAASSCELTVEERQLLEALGAGRSVAESAAAAFISRRTALRRLARAREKLGVASNAEAVVAMRQRSSP